MTIVIPNADIFLPIRRQETLTILATPPALVKAHQQLDKAVDDAYFVAEKAAGRKPSKLGTDAERVVQSDRRQRSGKAISKSLRRRECAIP